MNPSGCVELRSLTLLDFCKSTELRPWAPWSAVQKAGRWKLLAQIIAHCRRQTLIVYAEVPSSQVGRISRRGGGAVSRCRAHINKMRSALLIFSPSNYCSKWNKHLLVVRIASLSKYITSLLSVYAGGPQKAGLRKSGLPKHMSHPESIKIASLQGKEPSGICDGSFGSKRARRQIYACCPWYLGCQSFFAINSINAYTLAIPVVA